MRRKRRKVIVTVTETWTFVFDEVGEMPAPPRDSPVIASIPTLSPEAELPIADVPGGASDEGKASGSEAEQGG